ncbi:MAG: hypothetical protein ACOVNR_03840, partial [Chitinophagaceae bacterium]
MKTTQQKADEAFENNEFALAIMLYEKNVLKTYNNPSILSKIAYSYKAINKFDKALFYYEKLVKMPGIPPENWLFYGEILKNKQQYLKAKEVLTTYQTLSGNKIAHLIAGCDSALIWQSTTSSINVTNVAAINTQLADWGATPFNGKQLVFVSDSLRNVKEGFLNYKYNNATYGRTANKFQKIYIVPQLDSKAKSASVNDFSETMNSFFYHTGPVSFNSFYDTAYFTVTSEVNSDEKNNFIKTLFGTKNKLPKTKVNRLALYMSTRSLTPNWSLPKPFEYNNIQQYSVGHATITPDGGTLYFTSDMPGGVGGLDIWYCNKINDTSWSLPVNCGVLINTPFDEAFPVAASNQQLYFASKGWPGMGGYDLFLVEGRGNVFGIPQNLHPPINSGADDFYMQFLNEEEGYFSSNRENGKGDDDIYFFTNAKKVLTPGMVWLETTVLNKLNAQPIEKAQITYQLLKQSHMDSGLTSFVGKHTVPVIQKQPYEIKATKWGYTDALVILPETALPVDDTIRLLVWMQPNNTKDLKPPVAYDLSDVTSETQLRVGDKIVIHNLYYDFDKYNIRTDAA